MRYATVADTNVSGWEDAASPDFALCTLSDTLQGGTFERIDTVGRGIAKGKLVHVLGFGCTEPGGRGGAFGVLYEGNANIASVPVPPRNYYTVTTGGAALCFGDSGGGAYEFLNADGTRRDLIAINSRGNISTDSYLSTTSLQGFVSWARQWADTNGVKICGIHADAKGCRPQ